MDSRLSGNDIKEWIQDIFLCSNLSFFFFGFFAPLRFIWFLEKICRPWVRMSGGLFCGC
jgi:hypothetical protein